MTSKLIRRTILSVLVLTTLFSVQLRAAERPNIVFFLADDQRNDQLSCYGHPLVKTPNLDKLASQGTRFTNAFVTTSICAPAGPRYLPAWWNVVITIHLVRRRLRKTL